MAGRKCDEVYKEQVGVDLEKRPEIELNIFCLLKFSRSGLIQMRLTSEAQLIDLYEAIVQIQFWSEHSSVTFSRFR